MWALDQIRQRQVLDDSTSWQRHYTLTLDLATGAAEAAFLSTDFSAMERWITAVLQGARTLLDTIPGVSRAHTSVSRPEPIHRQPGHCLQDSATPGY